MTSVSECDGPPGGGGSPGGGDDRPGGAGRVGGAGSPGGARSAGTPVLLVTLYDPIEAAIVVAKLRSAGIEAFVRHEALSVVYGLTVDGAGRQDILVRPEDLEEARAALELVSE
ncbi:MAG: DUF2007 domain-containing protein [Actinomycetia bacterium]|nr:DUF2007 domain-containing protein [Actinomycetes bacterium]